MDRVDETGGKYGNATWPQNPMALADGFVGITLNMLKNLIGNYIVEAGVWKIKRQKIVLRIVSGDHFIGFNAK